MTPIAEISLITLEDTLECAQKLLEAAQTLGFLYVKLDGTAIPSDKISEMFQISQEFFASPTSEKSTCSIDSSNKGWNGMHIETLNPDMQKRGDFKEAFNFGEFTTPSGTPTQLLPRSLTPHSPALSVFSDLCRALCTRILRLFSLALEIPASAGGPEYFTPSHTPTNGPSGSVLRLLYYPASPPDYNFTSDIRAGAHSDYGSLTLLFQCSGQTGLEILAPQGGWRSVPVIEGAVCVNIGDLLSYWTGGLLKSTVHRVVVPVGEDGKPETGVRYSMVYFCHPVDATRLEPIPSKVVEARGERGANDKERPIITAVEHLKSRLAVTYGWKGEGTM